MIEMFVDANDQIFQQEIMRVLFKYMTIRRELLFHFQRTILVFRSGIKASIENIQTVLSKCKMLIQDTTVHHMFLFLNLSFRFGKCLRKTMIKAYHLQR